MSHNKSTVKIEQPLYTMNINQDPYHEIGGVGSSGEPGAVPEIDIRSITGVDLDQLDMPHMLEVLRGIYDRQGTRYKYRSRGFRVQSQAGTVTDIQASLYFRFQYAGEQIDRLVRELKPMIPDPDLEDCEAARELVIEGVNELVEESRWPGGPRKLKLEGAFRKLAQYLILLKNRFGLIESRARTQSEAENWAKFVTIMDIYSDMENSWKIRKNDLDRTGSESFGNQVVWLNRLLSTVKEAAARLRFQLKALLVGEAEMATKFIGNDQMTIAELLDWTSEVCDRGLMVSLRAGKDGMFSLSFDLENLEDVYTSLISDIDNYCDVPITELCEEHIYQTLEDIVVALTDAETRARLAIPGMANNIPAFQPAGQGDHPRQPPPPRNPNRDRPVNIRQPAEDSPVPPPNRQNFLPAIMGISPSFGEAGTSVEIDLIGQNFHASLADRDWDFFPRHIYQVTGCKHINDTRLRLTTEITPDPKWTGPQELIVLMDREILWRGEKAFYVIPRPGTQDTSRSTIFFEIPVLSDDETSVTLDPVEIILDPSAHAKRLVIVPTLINSIPTHQEPVQKTAASYSVHVPAADERPALRRAGYAAQKTSAGSPQPEKRETFETQFDRLKNVGTKLVDDREAESQEAIAYHDFTPVSQEDLTGEREMPHEPEEEWGEPTGEETQPYESLESGTFLSEDRPSDRLQTSQDIAQQGEQTRQPSAQTAAQGEVSQTPATSDAPQTKAEAKKKRDRKKTTGAS